MWFFSSPQIIFGEDALSWLSQIAGKKAFIVTDKNIVALGFAQRAGELLAQSGMEYYVYSEIAPDPPIQSVQSCAAEMAAFEPDWVIGLGGGSCLDAAKAAWFLYERPDISLDAVNPMEEFGLRRRARFITISTTSGTGADVSWGFALADPEAKAKLVRVSRELIPDIALVDPSLVMGMTPQVTADSGMDVLSHAIEAYTCVWHNDFTDGLCLKAIQLVFDYLPRAYRDGSDAEARQHLHNAATIAGLGFSNTAIILAHALAHAVGGIFNTQHGRTVGALLPYTIEYFARHNGERYADIAHALGLPFQDNVEAAAKLVDAIRQLSRAINQPTSLQELGIPENEYIEALPDLVERTFNAPELLSSPRFPYDEDLRKLFEYAYTGKQVDF